MAIADRYTEPDTRPAFVQWLDTLSPENRATVDGWLLNPSISNVKLIELIRDDDEDDGFVGYKASKDTVGPYRKKLRAS